MGILVLLIGATVGGTVLLVYHEPGDYARSALPPGAERKHASQQFYSKFVNKIMNGILNGEDWYEEFSEAEVNSYLTEDFVTSGLSERVLPVEIREPRLTIDENHIRLAFRYGKDAWSTVISLDLRPWLVKTDFNVLALEIQGLHAGTLPISAQSLLEQLSDAARRSDIDVNWYRHDGNPVAVLHFQQGQRPTVRLQRLELQQGVLRIGGQPVEAPTLRALLSPETKPASN